MKFEDESVLEKENCIKVKNGRVETSERKTVNARVRPDYIHSVLICHASLDISHYR